MEQNTNATVSTSTTSVTEVVEKKGFSFLHEVEKYPSRSITEDGYTITDCHDCGGHGCWNCAHLL